MADSGIQSRIMKAFRLTIWFAVQIGLFVLVVMIAWFFYTIVRDGISAQMMTFESEPSQGWEYWRSMYRNEALRGWAAPMVFTALVLGTLVWGAGRTVMKIYSCFPDDEDDQAEQSANSPIIQESEQDTPPNRK
jgi:multidrug efflux pump subunit AcrB